MSSHVPVIASSVTYASIDGRSGRSATNPALRAIAISAEPTKRTTSGPIGQNQGFAALAGAGSVARRWGKKNITAPISSAPSAIAVNT